MDEAYWRYGNSRQQQQQAVPSLSAKRPRSDYDLPLGHDISGFYPREDERGPRTRDTESIGASYDRYLRSMQMSSYGGQTPGPMSGVMPGRSADDPRFVGINNNDSGPGGKDRGMGFAGGNIETPLPPGATSTLFVEGLPYNCSRREVSHIFRPFVGYKEVRLVSKEPRHAGGDPLILCFVDFASPAHAATAMEALQGYVFDEHDPDSVRLRLQFARYPGARSGGGRGRR